MISYAAIEAAGSAVDDAGYGIRSTDELRIALEAAEPLMVATKAVAGVLEIHREIPNRDEDGEIVSGSHCEECKDLDDHSGERVHEIYPCLTVREIQAALAGIATWTDMRNAIEGMVK